MKQLRLKQAKTKTNQYLDDYFERLDESQYRKKEEMVSFEEDTNLSEFGQEFGAIAEILGLTRNDGEEIKKCYMTYLDVFTSYYKTARAPEVPINVEEDSESLVSYQWNIGKTCAPIAVQKGKEKLEHFGIKLEEETFCKEQQSAYYVDTVCAEMQVVKKIKKTLSLQQDIMLSSPLTMVSKLLLKYYQSTLMDLL
ncbi:hypothetical protein Tco_1479786, partial [Tanacetum coccineum]